MKKKLLLLSAVMICIAIAAAGTLAYFTSDTTAHNVITSGGVDIGIREWADTAKTTHYDDAAIGNVMPKTEVTKIAEVYNLLDSAEAWVRVKLDIVVEPDEKIIEELAAQGKDTTIDTSLIHLNINTDKWKQGEDGYYYCVDKLGVSTKDAEGKVTYAVTPAIFDKVIFDAAMGNQFQNCTVTVYITAEAVQTAHNPEPDADGNVSVFDAQGWPNSEVTPETSAEPTPEVTPEPSDEGSEESLPLEGKVSAKPTDEVKKTDATSAVGAIHESPAPATSSAPNNGVILSEDSVILSEVEGSPDTTEPSPRGEGGPLAVDEVTDTPADATSSVTNVTASPQGEASAPQNP